MIKFIEEKVHLMLLECNNQLQQFIIHWRIQWARLLFLFLFFWVRVKLKGFYTRTRPVKNKYQSFLPGPTNIMPVQEDVKFMEIHNLDSSYKPKSSCHCLFCTVSRCREYHGNPQFGYQLHTILMLSKFKNVRVQNSPQ